MEKRFLLRLADELFQRISFFAKSQEVSINKAIKILLIRGLEINAK